MMAKGKMVKKMMAGGKTKKGYAMGKTVAKPDFIDIDKDGDKTESMKSASMDMKKAKGGGMMKKGYAKGKMVKKMMAGGKTKGAANGGKKSKVRGSGIAKKGVRPAKMR